MGGVRVVDGSCSNETEKDEAEEDGHGEREYDDTPRDARLIELVPPPPPLSSNSLPDISHPLPPTLFFLIQCMYSPYQSQTVHSG